MNVLLSTYSIRARLAPALCALLPATILWASAFPGLTTTLATWASVAATCGIGILLASIAHSAGRRAEPRLYAQWGGQPAVARLRYGNPANNPHELERRHAQLARLIPSAPPPSHASEERDPASADRTYEAWVDWLRGKVRDDHRQFPLVYQTVTDYGFRRNLYGLRHAGILVALGATAACIYLAIHRQASTPLREATGAIVNLVLLATWLLLIRPSWVRDAADSYAARLLETTDKLEK